MSSLRQITGCKEAFFLKAFEARKPEYLWVVLWRDQKALEAAHTNPIWREQIKKFEAGKFYKTIPLELVCECLGSFGSSPARRRRKGARPAKRKKAAQAMPGKRAG